MRQRTIPRPQTRKCRRIRNLPSRRKMPTQTRRLPTIRQTIKGQKKRLNAVFFMPWMSCVKLSINCGEVRFSLHVVFKRCNTLQKLPLPAEKFCPIPNNTQNVFATHKWFQKQRKLQTQFFAVERLKTQANTENRICCVVKQQKCSVRNTKCLCNNLPTWRKQQMSDGTLQTHSWLQPHGNQTKKTICKTRFCAKKRKQAKQQGKCKSWNFDCNMLKFWLHYLAYAGFSICILSIHIKTENVQNAFLCQKQTQADKEQDKYKC